MSLEAGAAADRAYVDQQNKFRGLVAEYKSRGFVEKRAVPPSRRFRSGLRALLLEARSALEVDQYELFLAWLFQQSEAQLADLNRTPVGYDERTGVIPTTTISLERELRWIAEQLRHEWPRINMFRTAAASIEVLVFAESYEEAIKALDSVELVLGATLWSVQLRIALDQLAGGLERQKQYTAAVRRVYKRGLLAFVAYHTSVRNEDKTTLPKFIDDIKVRIDSHSYYTA